jgi:hypothetical protein
MLHKISTRMADHIHERISELVKEIEAIRSENEREKRTRNNIERGRFESRWVRLQNIKHELEQLSKKLLVKKPPHSVRGNWSRDSGQS